MNTFDAVIGQIKGKLSSYRWRISSAVV